MISHLYTVIAFVIAFGLLVFAHEMGHYAVARWCGVKVLRFSVGIGKVLYSRRLGPDQTEWSISMIPLGGYVKMLDAREHDEGEIPAADLKREFTGQTVWRRIAIVAAGPIANLLLAIVLFSALYMHGMPEPIPRLQAVPEQTAAYLAGLRGGELISSVNGEPTRTWSDLRWKLVQLSADKSGAARLEFERTDSGLISQGPSAGSVVLPLDGIAAADLDGDILPKLGLKLETAVTIWEEENGPAMAAGLRVGDRILAVDGAAVANPAELSKLVGAAPGKSMQLTVRRDGQDRQFVVTPDAVLEGGRTIGRIKVKLTDAPEMIVADETPIHAIRKAVQRTWETSLLQLQMLGKMITGEVSWKNISGPISIADYAGQTARMGVLTYISFIAFISISLGVMNLLPIPVLDGGLLLYYSLEVLTGRPVPERFGEIGRFAGMGILMTLMIFVMVNDIARHLS